MKKNSSRIFLSQPASNQTFNLLVSYDPDDSAGGKTFSRKEYHRSPQGKTDGCLSHWSLKLSLYRETTHAFECQAYCRINLGNHWTSKGTSVYTGPWLCWTNGIVLGSRALGLASALTMGYIVIQLSDYLDVIVIYVDIEQNSNSTLIFFSTNSSWKTFFFIIEINFGNLSRHRRHIKLYWNINYLFYPHN